MVYDALSALTEAETFRPQFALIDIGLPVMDGFEVAQRMLQRSPLRDTKLVAVTGYGQERDRTATARAGFSAHLVKPIDADELKKTLEALE